ncbi:hypothetical protein [Roseixanthobacter glucoisosaccharinicivorans]|uniref:hypothetical protein n=1 Tax=Roseixanthobacter glucoisosaccharinicivorans TaxID=3119923 RepID=UPI00372AD9A1
MSNLCKANPCCGEPYYCVVPLPQHRSGMPWLNNPNWQTAEQTDNNAVDTFAAEMKDKLEKKRKAGYWGWNDIDRCTNAHLSMLLREHIEKGDPVDVANFAMMIHQRGERIGRVDRPDLSKKGEG